MSIWTPATKKFYFYVSVFYLPKKHYPISIYVNNIISKQKHVQINKQCSIKHHMSEYIKKHINRVYWVNINKFNKYTDKYNTSIELTFREEKEF